jgi:lysophospholipase L1-like esterase
VRRRLRPALVVVALVALAGAGSPPAGSVDGPALGLSADASQTGWIRLRLRAAPGSTVSIAEQVAGTAEPVTTVKLAGGSAELARVRAWRCDRRARRFLATSRGLDGSTETANAVLATPSCAHRLIASLRPSRPRVGRAVGVRVKDGWGVGDLPLSVCTLPPGGRRRCHALRLGPGEAHIASSFRAIRPGRWTVAVRSAYQLLRRTVHVSRRGGRLRVLATGDSMIQILDGFLARRLERRHGVRVRSDAHISTGISKPALFDWQRHARRQAGGLHPDATVVFIGANDGFPMGTPSGARVDCCGGPWIAEYARRARRMMGFYARGGAARVYWLLLPAPRGGFFRRAYPAVDAAIERAAATKRDDVRLIHLERVFTPGWRYRPVIHWHGRLVHARQSDGVHLSAAGASIAASIVIQALRSDGVIG